MGGARDSVWIVGDSAVLSGALAGALSALGWRAVSQPAISGDLAVQDWRTWARLVLVADDDGHVPVLPAAVRGHRQRLVVVTGALTGLGSVLAAVSDGATAVIHGDQPFPVLVRALDDALLAGTPHTEQPWRARLVATLRRRQQEARRFASLTQREQEVLGAMIAGQSAAEIADRNQLSMATVRSQIRGVLTKLEVTSQLAAVALAHRCCREPIVAAQLARLHQF